MEKKIRERFGKRVELTILNYSAKSLYQENKLIRRLMKLSSLPIALAKSRASILPNVEMDVTSRCTLNCRECSHLIPHHRKSGDFRDYDIEALLKNVDLLLPLIDACLRFRVIGGEPMMHKDLHVLLRRLVSEKKIRHIQIATNGTIIPVGENLHAMAHPKVSVYITNYGDLAPKREELVRTLKSAGVNVRLSPYEPKWRSIGGFEHRGYSEAEMEKVFKKCDVLDCKSLNGGKLYLCPRAFHASALGVIPANTKEFIDLSAETRESFFKKLNALYEDPRDITTCYYCTGGDFVSAPEVPCAEQEKM